MSKRCLECNSYIAWEVYNYSIKNFGAPLCRIDQSRIRNIETTDEALALYFELRKRGVPAELEKFDGHKSIDIAIPEAKMNIEVDGMQHAFDSKQALSDLRRNYFSFLKGYVTIHIQNVLVRQHLEETADMISDMLIENHIRLQEKHYW